MGNKGSPCWVSGGTGQRRSREGWSRPTGMADGRVVASRPGNAGRAKAPCFETRWKKVTRAKGIDVSLPTSTITVQTLQTSLQAKAKSRTGLPFLQPVGQGLPSRCTSRRLSALPRQSRGAGRRWHQLQADRGPGFGRLAGKIAAGAARRANTNPSPCCAYGYPRLKADSGHWAFRPIRDRVVQMAVLLVIGPIFEVDLLPRQYGFRPGLDAKMALSDGFTSAWSNGGNAKLSMGISPTISTRFPMAT